MMMTGALARVRVDATMIAAVAAGSVTARAIPRPHDGVGTIPVTGPEGGTATSVAARMGKPTLGRLSGVQERAYRQNASRARF
jgi:hypothetical protein